ncbi:hypothetical protein ETB97_009184 [Aspergillus alliaceus]|uniref:Mucin-7 n=1 Tax=Petromyces alliaceus TaxID=209559 RepID=A0A8H6E9S8_PETAA|nr:hypothetical protein ETB97_009184 [Aspergillus burnettii]
MADKGAHPGVRSLLARFENNNSNSNYQNNQNNTSPPSRGRSPVGSEHSGSRPMSKVRASFIAVDGATQSGTVSALRSVSSRSDSPVAPPSRVRSFNSDDLNAPLKSSLSPVSNDNERPPNEAKSSEMVETPIAQLTPPDKGTGSQAKEGMSSYNKENEPALAVPAVLSPSKMQTVTKRPSTIQVDKTASANQSMPKSTSSTGLKSSAHPRTPTSPAKPDHGKTSKPARPPRLPATRDSPKAPTTKPSRPSLNTAAKTPTWPARSSMSVREAVKSTASNATCTSKAEPRPPTKSARLPASATTPTLSSTTRGGATGATASSLSRKPSTLRSATSGAHRTTTPAASSVRKQASHPSLSLQAVNERPHSRVSNSSKAVDEGFLARMMRPTASSASKAHDKVEVKSPPRSSRASRAPVRPVAPKTEAYKQRLTKEKSVAKKPQEKSQLVSTKKEEPEAKTVDSNEDAVHMNATETPTEIADEPAEAVVDSSVEATAQELPCEKQLEGVPIEPSMTSIGEPIEPSATLEGPIQATDTVEEHTAATPSAQAPATYADSVNAQSIEPSSDLPNTEETNEHAGVESPAATAEVKPAENVTEMETKADDADADIGKLTLN